MVNGGAGNDYFAVDDNASITTLDGGAGNDTFQIGQAYANPRVAPDVAPEDAFSATYTTLGWLSRGNTFPLTALGGTGDDSFLDYSNQAPLQLEGGSGNDLFVVRAAAKLDPVTGCVVVDPFASTPSDKHGDEGDNEGEVVAQYNVNAPVNVVGGSGDNRLVVVGTGPIGGEGDQHGENGIDEGCHGDPCQEVDDTIVTQGNAVLGAGLNVTYHDITGGDPNEPAPEVDEHGSDGHDSSGDEGDENGDEGGLFFMGVDGGGEGEGDHGDGHPSDAADVVVSRNPTGLSSVVNMTTNVVDTHGDGGGHGDVESAGGVHVSVATTSVGQIVIRETQGYTRVYEQGTTIDSYTVALVTDPAKPVYVNVSAELAVSTSVGAKTVLVSVDGGLTWDTYGVLTFASKTPQTVLVKAIDDSFPQGPQDVAISMSSQSLDPTYNHALIRNVLAEKIDNDRAGFVITQSDGNTTVLAGTPVTGITDSYTIAPTMAPAAGTTVTLTLGFDAEDLLVTAAPGDTRWNAAARTLTFDSTNWLAPATILVSAQNEDNECCDHQSDEGGNGDENDLEGLITHTVTSTDPAYTSFFSTHPSPAVLVHIVGDSEDMGDGGNDEGDEHDAADVYVKQPNGGLLVATGDPSGDTYSIRLTEAPAGQQVVTLQSDGQTVASDACTPCDSRFTAGTAPTVTFDATNWWIPFVVRLTSNPSAPATDPYQPLQQFPQSAEDQQPSPDLVQADEDQGDNGNDESVETDAPAFDIAGVPPLAEIGNVSAFFNPEEPLSGPSLAALLCRDSSTEPTDPDAEEDSHEADPAYGDPGDENDETFECDDQPLRQPVILPSAFTGNPLGEKGAGAPPEFTVVSPDVTFEATGPTGAVATYAPATATGEVGTAAITYSQSSGTLFPLGWTTVTVTATDQGGNYQYATFRVHVQDTTPPALTLNNGNCVAEATSPAGAVVTYPNATATDAVGVDHVTYSTPSGSTFPIGTTTVVVTAYDAAGNQTSKSFTVTVRDTTPPVLTAPNMIVEATGPSGARPAYAASATDAVGPVALVLSRPPGSLFGFGTTSVTVYAVDAYGNRSATQTFTVTVQDTTPPVITAPDVVVEATGPTGAKVSYSPSATDAVGPVTLTVSIPSGTTFAIGTTPVTVTATDGHGNSATKTFNVKVQDTTPPAITAISGNLVVEATSSAGATVTYTAATATDAVGVTSLTYSQASGTIFALGITTVVVTAKDAAGNTTTRSFTVTVRDTTAPVLTCTCTNQTLEATGPAGAVATYPVATATDAVSTPTITYSTPSGSTFALGTTTVTVTAKDAAGNTTTKTFTITVRDTTPPAITSVSLNVVAEATSAAGAVVTYASAVATDLVGPVTITYSKASGATFALGTTTVTVTAKDGAGNTSTRTFTVTVRDTTPPVLAIPTLTVEATSSAGAVVTYPAGLLTDNVGVTSVTYSKASGSTFALGTTTVSFTAKDAAGNTTTGTFTVVVKDTTAPTWSSSTPANGSTIVVEATGPSGAVASYTASATDAVSGVTISSSKASGSIFALGSTTVVLTAKDAAGNTTTRTFTVLVRDTTPPTINGVPPWIVVNSGGHGANVTYPSITATDLVSGAVPVTFSTPSGSFFAPGYWQITVTAVDRAGNVATKTFWVVVL